jgi:hypothetical protein
MDHDRNPAVCTAARWIGIALVYFILAIGLGVAMAASHDFRLKGLHVHLNMLGWVSMALMGVIYRLFPQAAASRLATWHFALYQAALPVMMVGLGGLLLGHEAMEPLVAAGSTGVLVAVLLFALAVWRGQARASVLRVDQAQPAV